MSGTRGRLDRLERGAASRNEQLLDEAARCDREAKRALDVHGDIVAWAAFATTATALREKAGCRVTVWTRGEAAARALLRATFGLDDSGLDDLLDAVSEKEAVFVRTGEIQGGVR